MQKRILYLVLLGAAIGAVWYADIDIGALYAGLETWVRENREWGISGFIGATVVMFTLGFPASVLCPIAGAVFGFAWGGLAFSIGGMLATLLAFLLARWLFQDWVERKVLTRPRLKAVKAALENEGFRFLCLVRFLPVHGTIMSSLLATTKTRLGAFLLSSSCQIPVWLLFVYLGTVAADAAKGETSWLYLVPRGLGILALLGAMIYVTRVARKAVQTQMAHLKS